MDLYLAVMSASRHMDERRAAEALTRGTHHRHHLHHVPRTSPGQRVRTALGRALLAAGTRVLPRSTCDEAAPRLAV